jgi:ribose transport system substrate-binding protein
MGGAAGSLPFMGGDIMKYLGLLAAAAAVVMAGSAVAQDKKQLVIVVKGLDNPFFEAIHQGCEKWNSENASSEYTCFYTGPASTSDEAGEAQIVADMLASPNTAAIAISPSNAPLIAQQIRNANPSIPVMTLDADLTVEDAALRKTYLGTDNYLMGYRIGEYIKEKAPNGGKVCFIEGNPAADNILRRAQGARDALTGQKGLPALKGEGGWTEVEGCPVFTNDDGAKGVQAMSDILAANPDLTAFAIMGGWPLFGAPQPYRDLFKPMADKIASGEFVIGAADTIGDEVAIAREGLVTALVGQRPFEMGYKAPSVMIDLINGKPVDDPVFTGLDECTKDTVDTCIQK